MFITLIWNVPILYESMHSNNVVSLSNHHFWRWWIESSEEKANRYHGNAGRLLIEPEQIEIMDSMENLKTRDSMNYFFNNPREDLRRLVFSI